MNASGLEQTKFIEFLSSIRFLDRRHIRTIDVRGRTPLEQRRIADISALLPRLIVDQPDKDRWTFEELRHRLGWNDPFTPRHGHTFPTDIFVQVNRKTQDKLQIALAANNSGYISLIGPPGSGKSTLLRTGLLPTPRAVVINYLAFMPNEGHQLGRAEAFDFLHDLVAQLKQSGLGHTFVTGTTLDELRSQMTKLLSEAKARFDKEGLRTIIVVDGLDHVPREERPARSLLTELPLPISLPAGVLFVLGTQKLELEGIPPEVENQASAPRRLVRVEPLDREAVFCLVEHSGLTEDLEANIIFERSLGHPLSVRYLIEGARSATSVEDRRAWLKNGPAYGGDVENFYRRAWHDLENKEDSREVLALLALVEGHIRVATLDDLVDTNSVDKAWASAKHLLLRTPDNTWSIFHNSFRLFLREMTSRRHDIPAPALLRERYQKLATMARLAAPSDEQRWMELRYTARAEDHQAVLALCEPRRFRQQFIEGRPPRTILDDIRLSFLAAAKMRSATRLVELILARHEIEMRTGAMGVDRLIDAYIAVGDLDRAVGLIVTGGGQLSAGKAGDVVAALHARGRTDDARRLFEEHEPLNKLLGSEPVGGYSDHRELSEWARHVALFREPTEILTSIDRLRQNPDVRRDGFDAENLREHLRVTVACSILERDPLLDSSLIADLYKVSTQDRPVLAFAAARSANANATLDLTKQRFTDLLDKVDELPSWARLEAAAACFRQDWRDLAQSFFDDVKSPELRDDHYDDVSFDFECRKVFRYATLASGLGTTAKPANLAAEDLLQGLQSRLQRLGWSNGKGLAQDDKVTAGDVVTEIKTFATFLGKARSSGNGHDSGRWRINRGLAASADAIVETAAHFGAEALNQVTDHIDQIVTSEEDNLRLSTFRRAFAVATYKFQHDREAALSRMSWQGSMDGARTPAEYFSEVAEEAIGLTRLGEPERAKRLLAGIHLQGLGYALPAKKDPQYHLWRDAFERACREHGAGICERVALMTRLAVGMSRTEGDGAAGRIANSIIKWAAVGGTSLATSTVDRIEEAALARWSTIVESIARGCVQREPQLTTCAAIVFCRLALPFSSEHDSKLLADLIEIAPDDQVDFIVALGMAAATVDGNLACRSTIMQSIADSAAMRGRPFESDIITRWPDDGGVTKRGSTDDDKLRTVRSLEELKQRLADQNGYSSWEVNSAFRRASKGRSFEEIEPFITQHSILREDERSVTHAAMIAILSGRSDAAEKLIQHIEVKSATNGTWGSWQSGAKTRLRRVEVALRGDAARNANFDELCRDLSGGKEWLDSLLPDLVDILDLTLPRVTDAELWDILARQLQEFREYKSSSNIECTTDDAGPAGLLGDLFKRAFDLKVGALQHRARVGLRELSLLGEGAPITIRTICDLWRDGGDNALHAVRIAWECRDALYVRDAIAPQLQEWSTNDDLAVQRTVAALAGYWHVQIKPTGMELPSFYSIQLPSDDDPNDYNQPLGFSPYDEGLWTDDPYSWTWGLRIPLELLSDCSPWAENVLRRRTAVLMGKMGGRAAFGPETAKKFKQRYSRLDLQLPYHRPMATAALLAMRRTAGELVLAGSIDRSKVLYFLHETGAFNLTTDTMLPESRAAGVHRMSIPSFFGASTSASEWANQADDQDTICDQVDGWICFGSVSRFERRHFTDRLGAERLMVPSHEGTPAERLFEAWNQLPRVVVLGSLRPIYEGLATAGVVSIDEDIAGSFPGWGMTLCPRAAESIGLRSRWGEPFVYRDTLGEIAVRTVWWREGGFRVDDIDDTIHGYGSLLLARPGLGDRIKKITGTTLRISTWKTSEHRNSMATSSAYHCVTNIWG